MKPKKNEKPQKFLSLFSLSLFAHQYSTPIVCASGSVLIRLQ